VVEEISYNGPDSERKSFIIDKEYVIQRMKEYSSKVDYTKYLL